MKAKIKKLLCTILALTILFIFIVIALGSLTVGVKVVTIIVLSAVLYTVYLLFYKSILEKM